MSDHRYHLRNCCQDREVVYDRFDVAFNAAAAPMVGPQESWQIRSEPAGIVVASGVGPTPALFATDPTVPTKILLVDDNPADVELIQMALAAGDDEKDLHVVRDGEAALEFLRQRDDSGKTNLPDIVLLDLNLPGLNGHEVLRDIKADPELQAISVIVITNSDAIRDISNALDLAANAYLTKPFNTDHLLELTSTAADHRFTLIRQPGNRWS